MVHTNMIIQAVTFFPLQYIFVYKVLSLFYTRIGDLPQVTNTNIERLRNVLHILMSRPTNTFFSKSIHSIALKLCNKLPHSKIEKWEGFKKSLGLWERPIRYNRINYISYIHAIL